MVKLFWHHGNGKFFFYIFIHKEFLEMNNVEWKRRIKNFIGNLQYVCFSCHIFFYFSISTSCSFPNISVNIFSCIFFSLSFHFIFVLIFTLNFSIPSKEHLFWFRFNAIENRFAHIFLFSFILLVSSGSFRSHCCFSSSLKLDLRFFSFLLLWRNCIFFLLIDIIVVVCFCWIHSLFLVLLFRQPLFVVTYNVTDFSPSFFYFNFLNVYYNWNFCIEKIIDNKRNIVQNIFSMNGLVDAKCLIL